MNLRRSCMLALWALAANALAAGTQPVVDSRVVVIDHTGNDHAHERQTRVDKLQGGAGGKIHFRLNIKITEGASIHYDKNIPPYTAPQTIGDIVIYPLAFSRREGYTGHGSAQDPVTVSFDEGVRIVLEGTPLDRLADSDAALSKGVLLAHRTRTAASCGLLAQRVVELGPLAAQAGAPSSAGSYVDEVEAGGAANAADIRVGDVVLKLNGAPTDRERDTEIICDYLEPGAAVPVVIARRDGKKGFVVLEATLTPQK